MSKNKRDLKAANGRVLGWIEDDPHTTGRVIARDVTGRFLGTYDSSTGLTRDVSGKIIAQGDITSSLIMDQVRK